MKKSINVILAGIIAILIAAGCNLMGDKNKKSSEMKTRKDSVSYIIGTNVGNNFKQNGLEINNELFLKGVDEAMKGEKSMFSEEVVKKVMTAFQKEMMEKEDAKNKLAASKGIEEGNKFLDDNKKKEGVITLPSGLQYKVIKNGNGPKPKATDMVKVNYHGTLTDGTVFDSSYERKEPASFRVNEVIPGWTEILQLMPVGSTWEVYIPSNLAYGDRATGKIPAGSTLVFKVELLAIEKEAKTDAKPGKN
jgi:FKBP-type peptidyl-prolyl cis-trans isomerase FklB